MLRAVPSVGRAATTALYRSASSSSSELSSVDHPQETGVGGAVVPEPRRTGTQAAFKKGSGGRSSFSGNVVTIFGVGGRPCGFLGRSLVNQLAKEGAQLILPYRCDPYHVREHKLVGDLGQILFFPFHLRDEASIRKVVKYSNVVINLIGSTYETSNFSFYDVHEEGARRVARICREMGVAHLVHVSALNASVSPTPVLLPQGSHFLRSKGLGEIAVREEFPTATIVRPANMFGDMDKFISAFATKIRASPIFNKFGLYRAGEHTYKMPVFVNDVAHGIRKIVHDPSAAGQTFEFVGPHCYQLSELVDYMYRSAHYHPRLNWGFVRRNGYGPYFTMQTNILELFQKIRKMRTSWDWEYLEWVECTSDVLTGAPTMADLGMNRLTEFEVIGSKISRTFTPLGYLELTLKEIPKVPLPIRSPPLTLKKKERVEKVTQTTSKSFGANIAVNTL